MPKITKDYITKMFNVRYLTLITIIKLPNVLFPLLVLLTQNEAMPFSQMKGD